MMHEAEEIYGVKNPSGTIIGAAQAYYDTLGDVLDKRLVHFTR